LTRIDTLDAEPPTNDDTKQVKALKQIDNPDVTAPFLRTTIEALRKETEGRATLLGFIGSPFTLAAYSVEGKVPLHNALDPKAFTCLLIRPPLGPDPVHGREEGAETPYPWILQI
jgi:hypothetical protein